MRAQNRRERNLSRSFHNTLFFVLLPMIFLAFTSTVDNDIAPRTRWEFLRLAFQSSTPFALLQFPGQRPAAVVNRGAVALALHNLSMHSAAFVAWIRPTELRQKLVDPEFADLVVLGD